MPRKRKPSRQPARPQPKKKRAALKLSAREAHETTKKAQALQRFGLYKPARKISASTKYTARQERDIARRFNRAQSHSIFVQGKGTQLPFKRSKKGYVLTKEFRTDKRKIKAKGYDILNTNKGSIVPRKLGHIKVNKDGSITTSQRLLGKKRKVRSGTLTPKQTIKFINDVLSGKFEFPENKFLRMHIFDSFADDAFDEKTLKAWVSKYQTSLIKYSEKDYSPLTLDYVDYETGDD